LHFISLRSALEGPDYDNGEDPEHTKENADAASEDESDGPTLPRTESHEREMEPVSERAAVVRVTMRMMRAVVWEMGEVGMAFVVFGRHRNKAHVGISDRHLHERVGG